MGYTGYSMRILQPNHLPSKPFMSIFKTPVRVALSLAISFAITLALPLVQAQTGAAGGQAWPNKPIKWVVPYTPGGITDNATRMVLQKVQEQTGWTILVENKPGANSMLGADFVAKSAPDGYTMLTVIAAHAANTTLYAGRIPYDPVKSFAPVSLVGIAPLIMTAGNSFAPKDMKEFIAYAKANPGKVSFGSSGVGAAAHLTTVQPDHRRGHGARALQRHGARFAGLDGRQHPDFGGHPQRADAACAWRQSQSLGHVLRQTPAQRA
jgi:hypothetical protein